MKSDGKILGEGDEKYFSLHSLDTAIKAAIHNR
jgi:hypothetical protein